MASFAAVAKSAVAARRGLKVSIDTSPPHRTSGAPSPGSQRSKAVRRLGDADLDFDDEDDDDETDWRVDASKSAPQLRRQGLRPRLQTGVARSAVATAQHYHATKAKGLAGGKGGGSERAATLAELLLVPPELRSDAELAALLQVRRGARNSAQLGTTLRRNSLTQFADAVRPVSTTARRRLQVLPKVGRPAEAARGVPGDAAADDAAGHRHLRAAREGAPRVAIHALREFLPGNCQARISCQAIARQLPGKNCRLLVAHTAATPLLQADCFYIIFKGDVRITAKVGGPIKPPTAPVDALDAAADDAAASPQKLGGGALGGLSSLGGSASMPSLRSLRGREERWQRWG